jgi:HlyD family secretion protein
MIKNSAARAGAFYILSIIICGCGSARADQTETFQGVVELDEWRLAFESIGRLTSVSVVRGDRVEPGAPIATLDSALEATQQLARSSEAEAAAAQLALLRAGSRPEDVRSMEAQVRAARASEDLLARNLLREQGLKERGVVPSAAVDDLQGRYDRSVAERQSLEQRLAGLRRGSRKEEVSAAAAKAAAATAAVELEVKRLARHALVSPGRGVVLDVHSKAGEVAMAGTPVVTVGDSSHPFADVFVPQGRLAELRVGTGAAARVDGEPRTFRGKVEYIASKTEFTPRFLFSERERPNLVVRVRVRIDDPEERLHAGVPAMVTFAPGGERGGEGTAAP